MANDGTLKFDTRIDSKGFQQGIDTIGDIATKGLRATADILKGSMAAISGLGAAAIKVGSDFEAGMSKVAAISGASGSELEALAEKAKEMGASTKFSATESAAALEYMAMAGWKTEDMLDGISGIMSLAAASGEDLAATSDIVTDALTAFGMKAGDAGHFSDILAAASSNANTNVSMMGETFKYVAPVAGALGYTAEDTAMAIGLMANAGIKSSQAGTSLRSMLSRLVKPTDEVKIAMEDLGLSLTNTDGSMKSFREIMDDLRSGFGALMIPQDEFNESLVSLNARLEDGTLTQKEYDAELQRLIERAYGAEGAEKAKYAAMLAGQEAMSGLLAIVNASEADYEKLSGAIMDCTGSAEEMAAVMQDNLQGQLVILQSGLEGLGVAFYETIQTPLKDIAVEAQGMVGQLQDAFDQGGLEGMVTAFGDVLAQIVERVAGAAPDLVTAATGLVGSFCESLKDSEGVGEAAAGLVTSLVTAFFGCADDIWTTAIVLAGKMAQGLADGAPGMVAAVSSSISNILGCLSEWAPDFVNAGVQIIGSLAQGLADTLPVILQHGIDIVLQLGRGIAASLPELIPVLVDGLLVTIDTAVNNIDSIVDIGINIVMSIADGIIRALPILVQKAPDLIVKFWEALNRNLVKLIESGVELVVKLIEGIISAIPELIRNLPKILEAIIATIRNFDFFEVGKSIILAIAEGIISIGSYLIEAVKGIDWASLASNMATMASDALGKVKDRITETVTNIVTSVGEFFSELPGKIWDCIVAAVLKVAEWGLQMREAATSAASSCVESIVTWIAGLPEKIAYWLGYAIGTVIKWGLNLKDWVTTEIPKIIDGIVTFFSELPGKVGTWLAETVTRVLQWGIELKDTVDTWVEDTINSAVEFFSELPGKVWTWLVDTVNKITQWGINLYNTASTWVTNTVNAVVQFFSELPGKIWTWLVSTVNKVVQWGADLLSAASSAAQEAVNRVAEWFRQLPEKIWTWLVSTVTKVTQFASDLKEKAGEAASGFVERLVDGIRGLPDQFREIGSNIVSGIWSGISDGWNWLVDKVKGLADSLFQGAKDALGIHSPSRVFEQGVGHWIPPGIGVGIEKAMPDLYRQVDAEMDELAGRMQTAVAIETGGITVRTRADAEHRAYTEFPSRGGDTYIDNRINQENNYHVPVASPSETSRRNREAARKLLGGVH